VAIIESRRHFGDWGFKLKNNLCHQGIESLEILRLNQDRPYRGDTWRRYKISGKVPKGKTPLEFQDSGNWRFCEQEIEKIPVGNTVNDRSRPSMGTHGRDRKPIDISIIGTHIGKCSNFEVGETQGSI
jgi:hypothetical protein